MSQKLKETIAPTAIYYGRNIDEAVLDMMAGDLADLDPEACIAAYSRYRRNPSNRTFPLPAQIRELVAPEEFVAVETQARDVAARVVSAVSKFGWNNARGAQEYIGPIGWSIVSDQGGWSHICQNLGVTINPTTFQAQIRDLAEGRIRYGVEAIEKVIQALPESKVRKSDLERPKLISLISGPGTPDPKGVA